MRHCCTLLLLLLSLTAFAEAPQTTVIPIMSRPAASLLDAVRPMLGEGSGVSAFHDRLIVRGTAAELERVRALVGELDRPARRLLIEVRQAGQATLSSQSIGYGVRSDEIRLGRVPPGQRGQLSYRGAETRGQGDSLQRIQALDGQPAFIRAGQSVPVYQAQQQLIGNTIVQGFNVHYRDTGSGFLALPRVHGDQVTIEIYQQTQRPLPGGRFSEQQASTVLRGQLGQWLTLGATGGSESGSGDQLGRHVKTRRAEDRRLELRVLPVD